MIDTRGQAGGTDRLRAVDGLRFVAAFAVVLFHFTGRDSAAWGESVRVVFPTLSRVTAYGGWGPYLFFMISGFVVLMSAWGRPVHSFVASRVGRLFPAYWLAVLLVATVLFFDRSVLDQWASLGFSGVLLNLTMVQSAFGVANLDPVFWTLWVELKFYALLAGLALLGITRTRLLALCLAWPVLGALAAQADSVLLVALLEPSFAPFFCIGILMYLWYRDGRSGTVGLLLALNLGFALWACSSFVLPNLSASGAPVSFPGLAVMLALSVAALGLATLTRVNRVGWRWLTSLGVLTYPLYLIHELPGWVLIRRLGPVLPAYLTVALVTLVMLVAAYLVHRLVERPLGGWLRRTVERDLGGTPDRRRELPAPVAPGRRPDSRPDPEALAPPAVVRDAAPDRAGRPHEDAVLDAEGAVVGLPLAPIGR